MKPTEANSSNDHVHHHNNHSDTPHTPPQLKSHHDSLQIRQQKCIAIHKAMLSQSGGVVKNSTWTLQQTTLLSQLHSNIFSLCTLCQKLHRQVRRRFPKRGQDLDSFLYWDIPVSLWQICQKYSWRTLPWWQVRQSSFSEEVRIIIAWDWRPTERTPNCTGLLLSQLWYRNQHTVPPLATSWAPYPGQMCASSPTTQHTWRALAKGQRLCRTHAQASASSAWQRCRHRCENLTAKLAFGRFIKPPAGLQ